VSQTVIYDWSLFKEVGGKKKKGGELRLRGSILSPGGRCCWDKASRRINLRRGSRKNNDWH